MNMCRKRLLIAMQLCSPLLSLLFVAAAGSVEGSMAMLWLQAICSKAADRSNIDQPVDPANEYTQESCCLFDIKLVSSHREKYGSKNKHGRRRQRERD